MPRKKKLNNSIIEASENIDIQEFRESVRGAFCNVEDPRRQGRVIYPMWYLLLVVLSGFLSGCNTISDLEAFARYRHNWLVGLTGAVNDPPTYDTLWMLLVRLKPDGLKGLMQQWLDKLPGDIQRQVLALDGKRARGATYLGEVVHLVELVATDTGITITQERVPSKRGEAAALGPILERVDVKGAILSMDALYTTTKMAILIQSKGADYILALKRNQGKLYDEAENFFVQAAEVEASEAGIGQYTEERSGHGRRGHVIVSVCNELDWLPKRAEWAGLQCLIEVRSIQDDGSEERRYYISSCKGTAQEFADWIRSHWAIENNVHWVADVVFREDASKASVDNIQENMALVRRLAMNVVRTFDKGTGMADARRACIHSEGYLLGLLGLLFGKTF